MVSRRHNRASCLYPNDPNIGQTVRTGSHSAHKETQLSARRGMSAHSTGVAGRLASVRQLVQLLPLDLPLLNPAKQGISSELLWGLMSLAADVYLGVLMMGMDTMFPDV